MIKTLHKVGCQREVSVRPLTLSSPGCFTASTSANFLMKPLLKREIGSTSSEARLSILQMEAYPSFTWLMVG